MADGEAYAVALDADTAVEFEFEEEQVMRGVNLQYSDKMDEAEEYFEGLKAKHARFSLHHAEVAVYKALMSNDADDIALAISLLAETEVLASQQEQKWRTHSRMKKVNAAMSKIGKRTSAFKSWALSKVTKSKDKNTATKLDSKDKDKEKEREKEKGSSANQGEEEDGSPTYIPGSREEKVQTQRARRMRLRALQIQAECALMTALLQMVAAGESWTNMVKAGYNIKRTWSIFQHCESKLEQIKADWVSLGGSMNNAGPENFSDGFDVASEDASDEDDDAAWGSKSPEKGSDNATGSVQSVSTSSKSEPDSEPAKIVAEPESLPASPASVPGDDEDFGDFAEVAKDAPPSAELAKDGSTSAEVAKGPADVAKAGPAEVAKPGEASTNPFDDGEDDGFGDFMSVDMSKKALPPQAANTGKIHPIYSEDVDGSKMNAKQMAALGETKGVAEDVELLSLRIGLEFGVGLFNLMMSLIPPQFQKLLEVMGFPADREAGQKLLNDVASSKTCRAPLASLMLLQYHMVIMGFLPRSPVHSTSALRLLSNLPDNWKGSSIFKVLNSRFARYEGRLSEATEMVKAPSATPGPPNSCSARMRNVTLNELGWCLLLSADFAKAADCFGALYKDTTWFKVHYACLQSACLWEAGPTFHSQAAGLLRDIITLCSNKKSNKPGPVESYALRMATSFTSTQSAPLFPALELAAVYNGIQNMERSALERHMSRVEEALHTRCQKGSSFTESPLADSKDMGSELVGSLLMSSEDSRSKNASPTSSAPHSPSSSSQRRTTGPPKATFNHEWQESSKMLCRYLLGVLQKSSGLKEKASDSLRYVVVAGENIPGNMSPYSCYELGSLLMETPDTVPDGIKLLEKSVTYPPHEFQGRLKFVVTERMRMYKESIPPTSFKSSSMKKT